MGFAGDGIWDSDRAHDTAGEISYEAGIELMFFDDPEFGGKGLEFTTKAMNDGLFEFLLENYMDSECCEAYSVVILTMMAMRLGVTISRRARAYIWAIATDAGLFAEGVRQIRAALIDYEDGDEYDENIREVAERLRQWNHTDSDSEEYYETQFYEPDRVNLGHPECGNCGRIKLFMEPGRRLKQCAGCRSILYCGRSCQKNNWKSHEPDCASCTEDSANIEEGNDEGSNAEQQIPTRPEVKADHAERTI